jgi:hypothetical protein
MSLYYKGVHENYMIWSKYGGVGENVPQETFDDVIMPAVTPWLLLTRKQASHATCGYQ